MSIHLPLLAIDADRAIYERERAGWREQGIDVVCVGSMGKALEMINRSGERFLFISINADNIVYLPMLPVLRQVAVTPVFVITSRFTISEQVEALHSGADVYAPFQTNVRDNVLSALALLYRYAEQHKQHRQTEVLSWGSLIVLPDFRQAFCHDIEITLHKKEFDILCLLLRNHKVALTCETILRSVWGDEFTDSPAKLVGNHISNLRRKLSADPKLAAGIRNIHSVGYKFDPE